MQVHQEVEKLNGGVSAAAPAALSVAAAMVVLSSTTVMTRALALILLEVLTACFRLILPCHQGRLTMPTRGDIDADGSSVLRVPHNGS